MEDHQKKSLLEIEHDDKKWHKDYAEKIKDSSFPYSQIERYKHNAYFQRYMLEWLFNKLGNIVTSESVVLDFGCGTGGNAFLISKCFNPKKIFAFDLSEELINIAKINSIKAKLTTVEFLCSSFNNLPYEKESFDVVFASQVFHHFPYYISEALDVIFSLLKRNGYLLISEPICDSRFLLFLKNLSPFKKDATPDESTFNSKELIEFIKKGSTIKELKYFGLLSRLKKAVKINEFINMLYILDEILLKQRFMSHFASDICIFAVKKG